MTADKTMTDVDTSSEAINRFADRWDAVFDTSEFPNLLRALAAERDELERLVEKHEANNGYNAMLQLGMMQLLKEAGVWPKSSEIIAAHGRHEQETQERLDRATKDEAFTAYQRKGE